MIEFRLIRDTNELEDTCYFEFLPRKYDNKCWNSDSVYLDEEVIYIFDFLLEKYIPNYDHFSFMEADYNKAQNLAKELIEYSDAVKRAIGFNELSIKYKVIDRVACEVNHNWEIYQGPLANMLSELGLWIKESIVEGGCLTVMGM